MNSEIPLKDRVPGRSTKALKMLKELYRKSPQEIDPEAGAELFKFGLAYPVKGSKGKFALPKTLIKSDYFHAIGWTVETLIIERENEKSKKGGE